MSGGCLENTIKEKALEAWNEKRALSWTVDTTDDQDQWLGYGLGCKGTMTLIFEPILFAEGETISVLDTMLQGDQGGTQIIHAFCPSQGSVKRAMKKKGKPWSIQKGFPEPLLQDDTLETWISLKETLTASVKITVFGSGRDVVPLLKLATSLSWDTTIVLRTEFKTFDEDIPTSCTIKHGYLREAARCKDQQNHYIVLMTHNFESDLQLLECLAEKTKLNYIGLLGPEHRKQAILKHLPLSQRQSIEAILHAPIGLPLGGRLPKDIALSIVAEIQELHQKNLKNSSLKKHQDISVVILAAGESKRLQGPMKQTLHFKGESLLKRSVKIAKKLGNCRILVVLGHRWQDLAPEVDDDVGILINANYQEGLSSSIKLGFKAAIPQALSMPQSSVLFLLADQPLVSPQHLKALVAKAQKSQRDIVASRGMEKKYFGTPALFAASIEEDIAQLKGDAGCRSIIMSKHADFVDGDRMEFDVDTPEDLASLRNLEGGVDTILL